MTSSQPVSAHRLSTSEGDGRDGGGEGVDGGGGVAIESFTQPSKFDELIVGTQIPCTPGASQVGGYQSPSLVPRLESGDETSRSPASWL